MTVELPRYVNPGHLYSAAREVLAPPDPVWPPRQRQRQTCSRRCVDGQPCSSQVSWAGSCRSHMTEAEAAERDEFAVALYHQQEAELNALAASRPAAFTTWPVTDEIHARLEAADAISDDEDLWAVLVDILYDWHSDRCAVCGHREWRWDLMTDHDHRTSFIRGFLCRSCNISEGTSALRPGDPIHAYRANPPAIVLGIRVVYWDRIHGWAEPEPPPPTFEDLMRLTALRVEQLSPSRQAAKRFHADRVDALRTDQTPTNEPEEKE